MKLNDAKRIVIKIGSGLVTDTKEGVLHSTWLASLADDIAVMRARGQQVIIVSSGAIALGRKTLNHSKTYLRLEEKQAAAACGQLTLIQGFHQQFSRHTLPVAQILLSIEDSEDRRRYLNARNTLETLLKAEVIPIINENDTVATEEIRVGDNDRLAARVAQMVSADLLILLSDIDGLYTADPSVSPAAKHIAEVTVIDEKIEAMAGGTRNNHGTGGMVTKLLAAKIALASGCHTIITRGEGNHPLKTLEEGGRHTVFLAHDTPEKARKRWIGSTLSIAGEVTIDKGAAEALSKGKSLLPAGVTQVKGHFRRGDAIAVKNVDGKKIAHGLSAYDADDALKILGRNSGEIESILGYTGRDALIHRDDLAVV